MSKITPADINKINQQFWAEQETLMNERIKDSAILETAISDLETEYKMQIPIYSQSSFEILLDKAAQAFKRFRKHMSLNGGKAIKADPLQLLIIDIVKKRPKITEKELFSLLKDHDRASCIIEIDDEDIRFINHNGKEKIALITGLKDRLSRAKRKLNSR